MKRKRKIFFIRNRRIIAMCAMLLLLLALCVPVFSGALAADEEQPLVVPISQETAVFGADGAQIGTLAPDAAGGTLLQLYSGESFGGITVVYDHSVANNAEKCDALAGKTLVRFIITDETATPNSTPDATPDATPEATSDATPEATGATMPTEGWIDAALVVVALFERHAADTNEIANRDAEIISLQSAMQPSDTDGSAVDENQLIDEKGNIFSAEKIDVWVPVAAIAIGIFGLGFLALLAISASNNVREAGRLNRQVAKLNERLAEGLIIKTPLRVEQIAWPREGRVQIVSEALDRVAALLLQGGTYGEQMNPFVKQEEPAVPEGEEPDLLKLANRLAGVASAAEWKALVKEAGWRAVLLQSNPTEKGTYIADDSGYSIIACLMRNAEAEIAYVVPSYQDPNASEQRWSEFYAVTEGMGVRNYRVDALAVMYIERGTFFLQKSMGKLIRRPQFF